MQGPRVNSYIAHFTVWALLACFVFVVPVAGGPTNEFCPAGQSDPVYLQIVLDRSGSMEFDRAATGRTRCEDSILEVRSHTKALLGGCPAGSRVSVLTFFSDSNDKVIIDTLIDFSSNGQVVQAALDVAPPCDGGTPLADAVCAGVERLNALGQPTQEQRHLLVITDGEENRSVGTCSGPATADPVPPYSPGSWPAKVFVEVQTTTWLSSFYDFLCWLTVPGTEIAIFEDFADVTGGLAQLVCDEGPRARPLFAIFASDFESGTTENWSSIVPGPDFTWSPQNPIFGDDLVTFTTSSPGPWSWIFPGGLPANSSEQNPEVFFLSFGEKAVSLTTSNRRQKVVDVIFE